jgi:transposase
MIKSTVSSLENSKLEDGECFCFVNNKKNGDIYVYAGKSKRVPGLKNPVASKRYLGKLNQETGEIQKTNWQKIKKPEKNHPKNNDYSEATSINEDNTSENCAYITTASRIVGPYLLLDKICKEIKLFSLVKRIFPDKYLEILSIVYYIVQKGQPLYFLEGWSVRTKHPFDDLISSQRISELLREITEDDRQNFLNQWINIIQEKEYLCYDITSISSYSKASSLIRKGYNRDKEKLEQLNMAILYGQESILPAYYRKLPGNLNDVQSLKKTTQFFKYLNLQKLNLVLDRGFYSKENLNGLLKLRINFILSVPTSRKWVEHIIDKYNNTIHNPDYYYRLKDNEVIYSVTTKYYWGDKNILLYVHLYYNDSKATKDQESFMNDLLGYKEEIETGKPVKSHQKYYSRYLFIDDKNIDNIKVTFNCEEILSHRQRHSGYFCLVSKSNKDPMDVLYKYRNKDIVENSFDDLKNHLDMKRLRVHADEAMYSRIFLQFIALIFVSRIRQISKEHKVLRNMSVREIMQNLESIVLTNFKGKYKKIYTELPKHEKIIMEAFGLNLAMY